MEMRFVSRVATVAVAVATLMASGCIPEHRTDRANWGVAFSDQVLTDNPSVVIVGDSLIARTSGVGSARIAWDVGVATGRPVSVDAVPGASLAHFTTASLLNRSPSGAAVLTGEQGELEHELSTIQQHAAASRPDLVIVALGTNDARLMYQESVDGLVDKNLDAIKYTLADFTLMVDAAIDAVHGANPDSCVLFVNVAEHGSDPYNLHADQVNNVYFDRAWRQRGVAWADWHAYSAPHPDWFMSTTDYHHQAAGKTEYRSFLTRRAVAALQSCS